VDAVPVAEVSDEGETVKRIPIELIPLFAVLILPAAAAAQPVIETEFMSVDLGKLPPVDAPEPQAQPVAVPAVLAEIDQAYLNRHIGGNLEESNAALRSLLAAQPGNPDVLWRLARGLHDAGRRQTDRDQKLRTFAEAEGYLIAAVGKRPDDALIHYWVGRIDGDQNEIKRTLGLAKAMHRELDEAIRLDPRLADAHHYLGVLLHQLPGIFGGDKEKAVAELEAAVRLTPNEASHYPALAEAYLAVKDKTRAIEAARKTFTIKVSDDPGGLDDSLKAARELLQKLGSN
jgi:tetratricopeptide (TPR) repeat protein